MSALTPLVMIALTASSAAPAGTMSMRPSPAPICTEARQMIAEARGAFHLGLDRAGESFARAALLEHGVRLAAVAGSATEPLRQAMARWNGALGEHVFSLAAARHADIVVRTVSVLQGEEQGRVDTQTTTDRDGNYNLSGAIEVCDNSEGAKLRPEQIAEVITHELGHVLGLDDDPSNSGIMGAFDPVNVVTGPSDTEVSAVLAFRSEARRLLR